MSRLSHFIRDNAERILSDWETFARGLPMGSTMDLVGLRDHANEMLQGIARDLETPPTPRQQADMAKGKTDVGDESSAAQQHGAGRARRGFTIGEMVAEFRALRATVIGLWVREEHELNDGDFADLIAFNEAIDQAIAESVTRFTGDLNQSRDRFLGILGHDLRTPLNAITMSASFLLETGDLHEPTLGYVKRIASSARRMNQMVADILDFARTQFGGEMPIARAEVDLKKVVDEVASEVAASSPEKEVRVDASGELKGQWDGDRLAQALTNLIDNATHHGASDTPIKVAARGTPTEVVISVENQGPVIPNDKLAQVFSPMKQGTADGTGDDGHLGLGLYIVDSIVRAHGGRVDAQSSAERGTTFTVHLPRQGDRMSAAST